jgi:hypothetical protein
MHELNADDKPRPPPIEPSPIAVKGGLFELWDFLRLIDDGGDWNANSLRIAEAAKSNDEAAADKINQRVRLFAKTETEEENCVALLMDTYRFWEMSRNLCHYTDHQRAFNKICYEKDEVVAQNKTLKLEIRDLEKQLDKLQASGPAAAATWRCRRQIDELRVRLSGAQRRISALQELQEAEKADVVYWRRSLADGFVDMLKEANLLPPSIDGPDVFEHAHFRDLRPSPTITSPVDRIPSVKSPCRACQYDLTHPYPMKIDTGNSVDFPQLATRHSDSGRPSREPSFDPDVDTAGKDAERSDDQRPVGKRLDWARLSYEPAREPDDDTAGRDKKSSDGERSDHGQERRFDNDDDTSSEEEDGEIDYWRPRHEPGCTLWRGRKKRRTIVVR